MRDKVNVDDIIGLVKTDEVTNSVEEVRKLRGRGEKMNEFEFDGKCWKHGLPVIDTDGNEKVDWQVVPITHVPVPVLLQEWEDLVHELSDKEVELLKLKEYIQSESFHLETTVDFKELYGKNNADVRKQHIRMELDEVFNKIRDLELSIGWIKSYIPLLKEVIRSKQ